MEIVPAIEEATPEGFREKLDKVASFAARIQVDFNDGSFAGFTTVKPEDISGLIAEKSEKILFEAHLMVQKPYDYIPKVKEAGFKKIIIQREIEGNLRDLLEQLVGEDLEVGIAIGPETSALDIEPFVDFLDTITVMDIEPGKQGQKFMLAELQKIRELKEGGFPGEVQADGAINDETIRDVIGAGPDTLVVGSYIVKANNPQEAYNNLISLI